MSHPPIAELIRDLDQFPSAPKVIPRLMRLLEDGNSSPWEVSSLIRLDPGIASRVLRVANSIYYGKGSRINSVDEAVARVGYAQVFEIVSLAAASLLLDQPLSVYRMEAEEVWRMSVCCAIAAESLALLCGEDRNEAYTVGLLHNVGMVAIDAHAIQHGDLVLLTRSAFPFDYTEAELEYIGHSHPEIGSALLTSWEFPKTMSVPVRWQYSPGSCQSHRRMAAILHVAKWIQRLVCSTGAPPALPSQAVLSLLHLGPQVIFKMAGEVRIRLMAVRHLLEES